MEHFVKSFTIIDFLGIFCPGAVLVLAIQFWQNSLTEPFTRFFGENDLMLAVYFVFLSYLCGTVLHDLGSLLESALTKIPHISKKNMHSSHWNNERLCKRYQEVIGLNPPDMTDRKAVLKAGKNVFHYIQKKERPQRILIFSAFFTMSRTFFVVLILIMVLYFLQIQSAAEINVPIVFLFLILLALCLHRWIAFEKKCVEEAYLLFLSEERGAEKKT